MLQLRKQEMGSSSNKGLSSRRIAHYAGSGLAIGAAIGMIFGLLLFEDLTWGCIIGAGVGLVIGATIDVQMRHRADSDE